MVPASELTEGMVIRVEGQIYRVLKVQSKAAAAKLGGMVKAELSNVVTSRLWEARFRPQEHVQEHVEDLQVERRNLEFLFPGARHPRSWIRVPSNRSRFRTISSD